MMLPENVLDKIAVKIVEIWMLQQGILPADNWEPNDPICVRDYGPHRVWTIQGRLEAENLDVEALEKAFRDYLDKHNQLSTAVRFQVYGIEAYSHADGTFLLYVSIYHS